MIRAVDLFCGAGGTSTGLLQAGAALNREVDLLAINHWNIAIDTHTRNHPQVRHLCESLDNLDPRKVVPGGKLHLLTGSPECTHHSNARGGKPRSDQSRATAWHICRWAEALYIDNILIENVREFQNWGPLRKDGKPMKRKKGQTFRAFLNALESLGYAVDFKVLNCADYGDATTRQRLFIIATRKGRPQWPAASHVGKWRAAREVIDWSIQGQSLSARKKPLSPNTMRRIAAGLRKFNGKAFTLQWDQTGANGDYVRDVDSPLFTLVTKQNTALCEPFIVNLRGTQPEQLVGSARSVDKPLPALTSSGGHMGLCEPFLVHTCHAGGDRCHSVEKPLPTVTAGHRGEMALVEPFLVNYHGSHEGREDGAQRVCSVDEPLPTLDTSNRYGLVEPFVVKYYGAGEGAKAVSEPLDTVTGRDRFGLVEGEVKEAVLDIRFRMLQPHELSAAMGFPKDYNFAGNREAKVKQIGNAVPVNTAAALCKELLR